MQGIDWKTLGIGSIIAAFISAFVFIYNIYKDNKAKKREDLNKFLGDKEPVTHAALKIIRKGFSRSEKEAVEQIQMIMQGCLLEGSDRARSMLYYIVSKNKDDKRYSKTFDEMYNHILAVEAELDKYGFSDGEEGELNRLNFNNRISAIKKIFALKP